jgi:hypothetical protein
MRMKTLLWSAPLQGRAGKLKQYVSLAGIWRQHGYFDGQFIVGVAV